MNKIVIRRQTATPSKRTPQEIAELRAVREQFQKERPTLEQILASTGQTEAMSLGEYLHTQELLRALRQERERQHLTLAQLAKRTGYDSAVLSRLLSGRQTNTTLATVARIANALGKEVVHTLRNISGSAKVRQMPKRRRVTNK
jgi:DNA-binding phage protein